MTLAQNLLLLAAFATLGACGGKAKVQADNPPQQPDTEMASAAIPSGDGADALYARTCASCHGPTAEGVGDFPSLAKLDRATVQARLEAYRAGKTVGTRSTIMAPIAKNLSDAQIAALASYLGS